MKRSKSSKRPNMNVAVPAMLRGAAALITDGPWAAPDGMGAVGLVPAPATEMSATGMSLRCASRAGVPFSARARQYPYGSWRSPSAAPPTCSCTSRDSTSLRRRAGSSSAPSTPSSLSIERCPCSRTL